MSHRKIVVIGYGVPLAALFAFRWLASQGFPLGGNPHRQLLDFLEILVLPAGVAMFVVHFLATFCSRGQAICVIVCALLGGLLGPLLLHCKIQSVISSSPSGSEGVQIAYLLIPMVYFYAVAGSGIIVVITLKIYGFFRRKKDAWPPKD